MNQLNRCFINDSLIRITRNTTRWWRLLVKSVQIQQKLRRKHTEKQLLKPIANVLLKLYYVKCNTNNEIPFNMKCLYDVFFIFYINLLLCLFYAQLLNRGQSETITCFSFFYLHKCLGKIIYKLIKLIWDQVKSIDAGAMFHRWGWSKWTHDSQRPPPPPPSTESMKYVFLCGSVVEHCVSSAKGCGFDSQGTHILIKMYNLNVIVSRFG